MVALSLIVYIQRKKNGSVSEMARKLQAKVSKVWEYFILIKQLDTPGIDYLKLTK